VSDHGEVWSLKKGDGQHSRRRWGKTSWRRLKVDVNRYGYERVALMRDKRSVQVTVHVAVCEAFHGPRPFQKVCAHNDGNKRNNRASNLRWATQMENTLDSIRHGTRAVGERVHTAKLTNADVRTIWARLQGGELGTTLAREYKVSNGLITSIKNGRTWRHVTSAIH